METKDLEYLKKLMSRYAKTLKMPNDKSGFYTAEIRITNYCELECVITNMLKMCILALNSESPTISDTIKNPSIDVALILEIVLQLFPVDEFELLTNINEMLIADSKNVNQ